MPCHFHAWVGWLWDSVMCAYIPKRALLLTVCWWSKVCRISHCNETVTCVFLKTVEYNQITRKSLMGHFQRSKLMVYLFFSTPNFDAEKDSFVHIFTTSLMCIVGNFLLRCTPPPSTSSPIAAERWPLSTPGRLAVRTEHLKHSSPLVYCAYQRLQSKIVEHCSECLACNGYPSVPSHTLIWHLTLHVDSSAPIIHQESPIRITEIFPRRILLWWTQWSFVNCC